VVKIPQSRIARRSLRTATAVELSEPAPGRGVADFLVGLDRLQHSGHSAAHTLVPHAIGLVDAAIGWADGDCSSLSSATSVARERIHRFVRRHALDPSLDATTVAAACRMSRRTMYRALAEDGEQLTAMIRSLRVSQAQKLIGVDHSRPLARDCP
jgi:hypothetical protein